MKHMGADWLQKQIDSLSKPYQLSSLARDVADIMGQLEYGTMAVCSAFHDLREYYELKPETFSIENYAYKNLIVLKY